MQHFFFTEQEAYKQKIEKVNNKVNQVKNNYISNEDQVTKNKKTRAKDFPNEESSSNENRFAENQILIGTCIGAGVVITILIFVFIGYRIYVKKRHNKSKKHRSTVVGPTGVQSQVTLLPIRGVPIRGDQRQIARLPGNTTSPLERFPNNKNFMTSPPPYHESFFDNRNSFRNNPG